MAEPAPNTQPAPDPAPNLESLPNTLENAITLDDGKPGAGGGTPEDTAGFEAVIANLQKQNELLIEQNAKLTEQFGTLVRNGVQFNDNAPNPAPTPNPAGFTAPQIPENYVPLRELGREIGKPLPKE